MTGRPWTTRLLAAGVVVLVAALVLGQLLGQPVLLGYVETGSMEPTVAAGDGFVAVPAAVAGSVEPGDVVVFEARRIDGGGLTTHRVVAETDDGYVTKGDANPFTDQDAGEPPVSDGQVVAEALQVRGQVVTVPGLGTAIATVRSGVASVGERTGSPLAPGTVGPLLVGLGLGLFALATLTGRREAARRDPRRSSSRPNVVPVWVAIAIALVVVTGLATAAMVVPAGVHEYGIVSADHDSDAPEVLRAGESVDATYHVRNDGVVPMLVVLEPASPGVAVRSRAVPVESGGSANATVTLSAPEERGHYLRHVAEHRYLGVLPPALLLAAHDIHPLLALLAVNLVVAAIVVALSVALFGTGHLRFRPGGSHVPLGARLRRRFRR